MASKNFVEVYFLFFGVFVVAIVAACLLWGFYRVSYFTGGGADLFFSVTTSIIIVVAYCALAALVSNMVSIIEKKKEGKND